MTDQDNDGRGRKVVDGGVVQFGEGKAAPADSLDQTKDGTKSLEDKFGSATSDSSLIEVYADNMMHMGLNLRDNHPSFGGLSVEASHYIGYFIDLTMGSTNQILNRTFRSAPRNEYIEFITSNLMYGDAIKKTGIIEKIKENGPSVDLDSVTKFFPELKELLDIVDSVDITRNAYLYVLSLPVECRPFFAGVIQANESSINDRPKEPNYTSKLYNPITLKLAMDYAGKISVLPKVAEYMGMLE